MGGGYFLYDTCSRDMLALSADDHQPHPDRAYAAVSAQPPPVAPEYSNSAGEYACGQVGPAVLSCRDAAAGCDARLAARPRALSRGAESDSPATQLELFARSGWARVGCRSMRALLT